MTADAYIVGYLAERLDAPSLDELREAALTSGRLGRGRRFELSFARAVCELTFAGHLRAVARGHVTTDPDPWREDSR